MVIFGKAGRGNEVSQRLSIEYDRKNIRFHEIVDGLVVPYLRDGCSINNPQRDENYTSKHFGDKNRYIVFVPKEGQLVTLIEFAEDRGIIVEHISKQNYYLRHIPKEFINQERIKNIRMSVHI